MIEKVGEDYAGEEETRKRGGELVREEKGEEERGEKGDGACRRRGETMREDIEYGKKR